MKKVLLMLFIACFWVIAVLLWTDPVYAAPFTVPPTGGLLECQG
ncbi:MAG: hypothetical protein ACREOW_16900 [Thermodesulfobacteriota bacterium]